MHAMPLSRDTLRRLPPAVRVPGYDPAQVVPGIVHLGLGGFHRAHMARYTHDLMQRQPEALSWGIAGAGLLPADRRMHDALAPQQGLYTLVERRGAEEVVSVIGSIPRVIFAGESAAELLAAIDDPAIRIVSLTVTENGYCLNRASKKLDLEHELIRRDLAEPANPRSAIGIVVEACRRRRQAGLPGFTALSCDNIQHNGNVLRAAVLALAEHRAPDLAAWIGEHVSFPNTMVDRITPVTQEAQVAELRARYGIGDNWPVFSEMFTQWVIEDRFIRGRPAWEMVGAQFVDDVTPYEFMKLRLLNGSHLAVAGLGRLLDYTYIDETMADPLLRDYMAALMDRETGPTLAPVPSIDLGAYKQTLIERFSNEAIKDTVERVNTDAPINVLVDPIRDRLKAGAPVELLALALAAWFRRIRGEDEQGRPIEVRHPLAALLREKALEGRENPRPLLSLRQLFGELGDDARLVRPLGAWLASLYDSGARATLRQARARGLF
ncbi:mannitol dehydrogenase family protein [Pseudoroseomonas wenyumeiae]|uniref:Mannitol dehydrogenase family protein n=1 Tax=Teichococcus wenyumeiae TaxID=2478470 RepID=A0A3A9JGG3_9PROT|nr:mannitol dehydrogenase family protein [Pseudoroseomonas wenyumeiae]RKK05430.1 mannitol dehydrogenase family protein [Pseudoroseomonas wenyumeiae]RMI19632.1 mannitol dehydrogenase family protein [Pseudoroseomonas wenyumeiae]